MEPRARLARILHHFRLISSESHSRDPDARAPPAGAIWLAGDDAAESCGGEGELAAIERAGAARPYRSLSLKIPRWTGGLFLP